MLLTTLHIPSDPIATPLDSSDIEIDVPLAAKPSVGDIIRLHGKNWPCNPLEVVGIQHSVEELNRADDGVEFELQYEVRLHIFVERIKEGYHDKPERRVHIEQNRERVSLDSKASKSSDTPDSQEKGRKINVE